jgi:hypothetical protein
VRPWPGVLVTSVLASAAWAQGPGQFDGQYMGELVLTTTVSGDCTEPPLGALYPLTISRGEVRFAYVPRFATMLSGRVGNNGNFRAVAQLKKGLVQMNGRTDGYHLTADITSPSCHYTFKTR